MSLKRDEYYDAPLPVAKKAKMDPSRHLVGGGPEFADLSPLILDCMLSYLDVKSLFRFAFTCRQFGEVVTHEHVVQSALISGGYAKKTVTEVIELSIGEERTLFLPSPLRLLRLANGKKCEGGYRCSFVMNLKSGKKTTTTQVNIIRPRTGLFFCFDCLVWKTRKISRKHPMLENERVNRNEYSANAYVLKAPYTDAAGERAGPIVTLKDYNDGREGSMIAEADSQWPQEKKDSILKCLENAKQDREKLEKRKRDAKLNRIDRKREKAVALVGRLKAMLGEDCPHRDVLCDYSDLHATKQSEPTIFLNCNFVQDEMRQLILAPSKGTKKRLKEIAAKIRGIVDSAVSSGLLSFLDSDAAFNA